MTEERSCFVCKHFQLPKCPHINNDSMIKFNKEIPRQDAGDYVFEELKKLCMECPRFEPNQTS